MMDILYGDGWYLEGARKISGKIILGKNKIFLRNPQGDLPQTNILLESISCLEHKKDSILISVRLSMVNRYQVLLRGNPENITELTRELVKRLKLKKRFLSSMWVK